MKYHNIMSAFTLCSVLIIILGAVSLYLGYSRDKESKAKDKEIETLEDRLYLSSGPDRVKWWIGKEGDGPINYAVKDGFVECTYDNEGNLIKWEWRYIKK